MLIQLRVENHRSLRDEQALSLVAAGPGDLDDPQLVRVEGFSEALLPVVALYGANASGKSNVLGALGFMRHAVLDSHRLWEPEGGTPHEPFKLSEKEREPSLYEIEILLDGVRLRYGFVLDAARIREEWLYAWPNGRKQMWFEREGDAFEFGKNLHGENETIRGLTRPNSLFLSAAAQNNHEALLPLFGWFRAAQLELRRGPVYALDTMRAAALKDILSTQLSLFSEDNTARQRDRTALVHLLRAADVGVVDIEIKPREAGTQRERWGPDRAGRRAIDIHLRHKAEDPGRSWLPLEYESAGTITMLGVATRLIRTLRDGGLLCVDELEASLHPMLAMAVVRLFQDPQQNQRGAQLIFTTHDTNLIGNALGEPSLRRDQIWFTEKDLAGATRLYPLTDFHPRKAENLERGYLQGRYGAIPFLGQLVVPPDGAEND